MNQLSQRLPKDNMYIIYDYAKEKDKFDNVIREYEYKIRQLPFNVPKSILNAAWEIDIYMTNEEFRDFLVSYKEGSDYLRSMLNNKKFYYFC